MRFAERFFRRAPSSKAAARGVTPHSWTSPKARSSDLLYASTGDDGVIYVYTYPKGELVSGLFNSGNSYGLCSDPNGNVFVTNDYAIYEYPHGSAGPSAVLTNPFGATFSCSIDPTTGNLAAVTAHDAVIFQPGPHGWKQAKLYALSFPATESWWRTMLREISFWTQRIPADGLLPSSKRGNPPSKKR